MPEEAQVDYVGVDIAEARLDYCIAEKDEGACDNRPEGRQQLLKEPLKNSSNYAEREKNAKVYHE
jgi:hypothetical protein